ncbi:MAG TPA: type II secretion system F family protein [Aggregatilineales bacterium]|nr:type II secretion system F family protein [Aggregatilineales bacterium]
MSSSASSPKHADKNSYKVVSAFDMFYQLTFMSAMASAGISRSKTFDFAAQSKCAAANYFIAINTLVAEYRLDYPDACRIVGLKTKSENIRSFLLRLSDALRSGEPLVDFLGREAEVQSEEYKNSYERNLENLKQWSNAFSSITISVALIIIIQMISSMIYSSDVTVMAGLVATGVTMAGFGAWIIYRAAPAEVMTIHPKFGSEKQRRASLFTKILVPLAVTLVLIMNLLGWGMGGALVLAAICIIPIGIIALLSDRDITRKDIEFSTVLRSTGSMAGSSGSTIKQALQKIDLTSFPALQPDIERLSKRLEARVEPEICWHQFGQETGSRLISQVVDVFFGAIRIGGEPERVGYLCSQFVSRATQLRAKRRLISGTFSGLTSVMQAVVASLMVFVLSVITNFANMVTELVPQNADSAMQNQPQMNLGMAQFSPQDLQFLAIITMTMMIMISATSALAVIFADGGMKLKVFFYLAITICISGLSLILIPQVVSNILTI